MNKTDIEHLDFTWSPIAMKCDPVSEGCKNCWHLRMARRLAFNPVIPESQREAYAGMIPSYLVPERLNDPLKRKQPALIGVQFMGDLGHEDVGTDDFMEVMQVIAETIHTYLVLTKRPDRMKGLCDLYMMENAILPDNFWLGISAENQQRADQRISTLLQIPAAKKFVSLEPLLGPIVFPWDGLQRKPSIDWVIVGGETGPGARPMHPDWARSIRDQCLDAGVPFFFKGWGEWIDATHLETTRSHLGIRSDEMMLENLCMRKVGKKKAGRLLDGQIWDQIPER